MSLKITKRIKKDDNFFKIIGENSVWENEDLALYLSIRAALQSESRVNFSHVIGNLMLC